MPLYSMEDRFQDVVFGPYGLAPMTPYLIDNRLQDVVALLQLLALYHDYDLEPNKLRQKIARTPRSANDWGVVLRDHPEFFRESENAGDYCLVLRRAQMKDPNGKRPPLDSSQLNMLIDTAIHLQKHELEMRKDQRFLIPILISSVGIFAGLLGTILGAVIKASSG